MTTATDTTFQRTGSTLGSVIAVVINGFLLFVVNNLTSWDVASFITDEFSQVVPWINASLLASLLANLLFIFNDRPALKSVVQVLVNAIGIAASVAIWRVFPFDFDGYAFDWAILIRIFLIVAIVAQGIAIVAEVAKLARVGKALHA